MSTDAVDKILCIVSIRCLELKPCKLDTYQKLLRSRPFRLAQIRQVWVDLKLSCLVTCLSTCMRMPSAGQSLPPISKVGWQRSNDVVVVGIDDHGIALSIDGKVTGTDGQRINT